MVGRFRELRSSLRRSIFEGKRYENNMRGITFAALLIILVNIVTGSINLINGYAVAAVASAMFILSGALILFLTCVKKSRTGAVITALVSVIVIFTYEALSVSHGFPVFWTLLLPIGFCYFASVRAGIGLSLYFLALYWILFYTPLRGTLAANYSDVIADRFPLLYLADVIITAYIMIQYHLSMIHQMDNARMLMKAKEDADLANAAKSDFLASMSHEIRTPINAVLGMNEMILQESSGMRNTGSPEMQSFAGAIAGYAGNIESAGNNLLAIVNDILDFSKMEAGKLDIVEGNYRLSSVLNDLSSFILFRAQDKGLRFAMDVDGTLPDELCGDGVRVRQIIANLLNNAVKYTEQGSVRLTLSGSVQGPAEPGQSICLRIAVQDTGIGIRKEDIDQLFTKFHRLDLKRNSTVEGTGLGLAITHSLLEMMGGRIEVQSEYGKGSVFTVRIPQKIVSAEPIGDFRARFRRNTPEADHGRETFRAPEAHILVVDDTRMNLMVATGLLKNTGIRTDTAPGGNEAVALARTTAYDLILMDQRMPRMDGTEALHLIRAQSDGANRETPVICLTADAVIGARERYMAEGFTDYLTKPIDSRALERILVRYLPAEKVLVSREEPPEGSVRQEGDGEENDPFAPLKAAGIDTKTALSYCQDDRDLYGTLLKDYARSAAEKARELQQYYTARDWKSYAVAVHSLKSTSRMIGAAKLSEAAAGLEAAADASRTDVIQSRHDGMLELCGSTVEAIRRLTGPDDVREQAPGADDEILEFLPE